MSNDTLERQLLGLMQAAAVPGLSAATIQGGEIEQVVALGVRDLETRTPVDRQTAFEAASLSKPLFSYVVLQLVDAGSLDLDEPLSHFGPPITPDDPAASQITARHVLSHTTGLPNWRGDAYPLRTYFTPGSRFSYSGEGFIHLQSIVERITGEPLDALMQRLVFGPLAMRESSYVWQDRFDANHATPHDDAGKTGSKFTPSVANIAYSLHTTAADYGRFLVAVLRGSGLGATTAQDWFVPQVSPPKSRFEALENEAPETDDSVAWGLGWGLEPALGTFFHWGANLGATAFTVGLPATGTAVVVFANSDTGLTIVPGIAKHIMPGLHPSLAWLGLSQEF
jgi:CubicO group peptidase (beta-lactamase class C family)